MSATYHTLAVVLQNIMGTDTLRHLTTADEQKENNLEIKIESYLIREK